MQGRRGLALALPLDVMKAESEEQGYSTMPFGTGPADGTGVNVGKSDISGFSNLDVSARTNEMVLALIRQHLHHECGKGDPLVEAFEARFPRTEQSINKKSIMTSSLGIHKLDKDKSVLSNLVGQLTGDGPIGGNDGDTSGDLTQAASMTFSYGEDGASLDVNGLKISDVSSIPFSVVGRLDDLDLDNAELLGRGAGGRVVKAKHKINGTIHAVKEIIVGSDEVMTQVKAEISVLWGTSRNNRCGVSPFVIQCHGVFFSSGTLYIAMECMERSLKDAMDKFGVYNEATLQAVTFQTLRGLEYLHYEKKQLHRDIKPHNILYNKDGIVKVSDFGIASDKVETVALFQKGTFCGTLIYMSPARADGAQYSFEADIWSLGVTIIHLAMGQINFASSIFGISGLKKNPPRIAPQSPSGVPFSVNMQDFVAKCLNPDPATAPTVRDLLAHPWMQGVTVDGSKQTIISQLVVPGLTASGGAASESLGSMSAGDQKNLLSSLDSAIAF